MSGLKPFISSVIANVLARGVAGNAGPGYPSSVTGAAGTSMVGTITAQLLNAVLTGIRSLTGLGTLPTTDSKSISGTATTVSTGAVGNFRLAPIFGTNLSGLEWAAPGLRFGNSSAPNRDFTVPRASDIQYLANSGMIKSRLPFQWELLQPVLTSQPANSVVLNAYHITASGDFAPDFRDMITAILDAHAAAGTKVILDCHNYCRYQDFTYNADGSVTGFTPNTNVRWLQPYTTNGAGVYKRIFSLAANATLTQNDFNDLWRRIAQLWGTHPGLGGYDLMNEPHDMPVAGSNVAWNDPYVPGSVQDYTIWPAFAQSAINAIRLVDPTTPIYVEGNEYSNVMQFGDPTVNPGYPLTGTNLVYNAHMYLDAYNNGAAFDYDYEVSKNYSAGEGGVSISINTMYNRLKLGTDWAALNNVKLAITETGMPIDDQRWADMFKKGMDLATAKFVEIYTWIGGTHWPIHNYAINQIPAWHQNKTVDPLVSAYLKQQAGTSIYSLFDSGTSYGLSGTVLTITLFIRGYSNAPVTVNLARTGTGVLSAASVVIPAGPNSKATFTYTTGANEVATITYSGPAQVPPPRKIFSIVDPVTLGATNLTDAALTVMAKYGAAKWEAADGYTDYMQGAPAVAGDKCRAIADSGYASTDKNIFEMVQWLTEGPAFGPDFQLAQRSQRRPAKPLHQRAQPRQYPKRWHLLGHSAYVGWRNHLV